MSGKGPAVPQYSDAFLREEVLKRPLDIVERCLSIVLTLGGVAASIAWDAQTRAPPAAAAARARQLREALTGLGPAFVKLGQALSTRPDLLPPPYLEELEQLQDALPTFPDATAFALMEAELGAPLESVYSAISASPIAAASLGQVYKATLMSGEAVAVKVQRPGIARGMSVDFFLVRSLAGFADGAAEITRLSTSLVALVDDFAAKVFAELDYVQEGRNSERFAFLYGDRPEVLVPAVYWSASSARVLTMDWIEGTKLSDQRSLAEQGLDVVALVDIGIQCSLRQLLEHGYFHAARRAPGDPASPGAHKRRLRCGPPRFAAPRSQPPHGTPRPPRSQDPHPGNLLATADGRLAFIDFGMMSDMPPLARYAIIGHVVHLVNRDYLEMARDYYRLEFLDESVDVRSAPPPARPSWQRETGARAAHAPGVCLAEPGRARRPIAPALAAFFDDVLEVLILILILIPILIL